MHLTTRGLAEIVAQLDFVTSHLGKKKHPKLIKSLDQHLKALAESFTTSYDVETIGYECLNNLVRLGAISKYGGNVNQTTLLQLKKELELYAEEAFSITGNKKLLKEVERVSSETEELINKIEFKQKPEGLPESIE